MENPAYSKKHWFVLVAIMMMCGSSIGLIVNSNGVFYTPMAEDLGLLRGTVSMHGTFLSMATAFSSLTVAPVIERFGWKKTLFFGVFFGFLGTFLMAFAKSTLLIYAFGIIRGMGSAFYSMVPMTMIVNNWFQEKKGLAVGLASGTSGVIGAIAAPILASLIEIRDWRFAFIMMSIFIILLALPILFLPYTFDPRDEDLLPYGFKEVTKGSKPFRQPMLEKTRTTKIVFTALLLIGFLNTTTAFVSQHFPGYGESVGLSPETASFMLSAAMIGNLSGKFIFGGLSEIIGTVKTALGMFVISIISILMLIFLVHPFTLIIGSLLFGFLFSVGGVALPLLSTEFFDPVTGVKVYARVNFIASIGAALSVSVVGFIYDFTGSFIPAFVIGLVFNVINIIALLVAQKFQANKEEA